MSKSGVERLKPTKSLKEKTGPAVHGLGDLVLGRAEEKVKEKIAAFDLSVEGETALAELGAQLRILNEGPEEQHLLALHQMFEVAHDLRGQSASFGYPLVARACKSLCRLVSEAEGFVKADRAKVQAHIDALVVLVRKNIKGENATGRAIADGLDRISAGNSV